MPTYRVKPHRLVIALSLYALSCAAAAASSAYIEAVRADVNEFSGMRFALPESNTWQRSAAAENDGTASLDDFEKFVKSKFRGTYILFARLPEWKKTEIWEDYVSTGDLGGIRSNIYAARRSSANKPQRTLSNLPLDF